MKMERDCRGAAVYGAAAQATLGLVEDRCGGINRGASKHGNDRMDDDVAELVRAGVTA
jgi:hypothetical protein